MSATVSVQLDLPKDWDRRLSELLDKQDQSGKLTAKERKEAEALVELSDWLSLAKLRARFAPRRRQR